MVPDLVEQPDRAPQPRDPPPYRFGRDFPNRGAIARLVRLVGAVLAEQTDEWAEGRRYLGLDVLKRCRVSIIQKPNGCVSPGPFLHGVENIRVTRTLTLPPQYARRRLAMCSGVISFRCQRAWTRPRQPRTNSVKYHLHTFLEAIRALGGSSK